MVICDLIGSLSEEQEWKGMWGREIAKNGKDHGRVRSAFGQWGIAECGRKCIVGRSASHCTVQLVSSSLIDSTPWGQDPYCN